MSELNLPEGWEPKTLIDLADYVNGFPFKPSDWSETGLPIVRIAQITGSSREYDYFRGSISNLYKLETGNIIFSWSGTLCVVRWHGGQAWLNQHLFRVAPYPNIDEGFFFHLLSNAVENMEKSAHGSTMKHIKRGELKKYNVVIPVSLKEQQKIAQILDTLDAQIQKTEVLIAKLEKIKEGLLHDLLTRGIDQNGQLRPTPEQAPELYKESALGLIPKEWLIGPIEHALKRIIDYRGKTPTKTEHGIPLITAKNVRMGYIAPEPREFIASSSYDNWMTRGIPSKTDVVFTTEAPLGNVAQVGTDEKVAFAQRVIILQPKSHLRPELLKLLLMSSDFQGRAMRAASGSTALGIKQSVFRKLFIAHPASMAEQDAMSQILRDLDERRASEFRCLAKFTEMKKGLMDDLLTGRVRVTLLLKDEV